MLWAGPGLRVLGCEGGLGGGNNRHEDGMWKQGLGEAITGQGWHEGVL